MSMMKFDDSKIKEIRKRKEQGLPPPPPEGDVVEQSKNAKGGSELIYQRVKERVPEDLWNYFQSFFQEFVNMKINQKSFGFRTHRKIQKYNF